MAATADSSNHHSPCGPEFSGDGPNSPHHPRRSNLSSPWAQVVRGEPEPRTTAGYRPPSSPEVTPSAEQTILSNCSAPKSAPSPPSPMPPVDNSGAELSGGGDKSNAARSKPVWNKPSNGMIEGGAVMGAASWPALSTRASPKSSADSSPKDVDASLSTSQVPVAPPVIPLSPNKQAASVNPNSTPNHAFRQRSMKRGSSSHAGGGPLQIGFTRPPPPPPPPQFPVFQVPPNSYSALMPPMADSSPRETPYRGSTWQTRPIGGFVPQPHLVNDHRNSSRGNYGPHGDGSYHNNFGGRRDHDRGNTRDTHMSPQRGPPRGIVRAPPPLPPSTAPFISSQTMRPFLTPPIGFADVTSPLYYYPQFPMDSFRGVPFIAAAPPPPVLIPSPEPTIPGLILKQIEYYFSDANLITDDFLKSHMDCQGWVPVTLIAGFPRVKGLTNNIQLILDTLRTSVVVEVQDDKLRRRNEWMKWIPNLGSRPTESGSPSTRAENHSMLVTSFQKVTLDEVKSDQNGRTSPGSAHQGQHSNGGDLRI